MILVIVYLYLHTCHDAPELRLGRYHKGIMVLRCSDAPELQLCRFHKGIMVVVVVVAVVVVVVVVVAMIVFDIWMFTLKVP